MSIQIVEIAFEHRKSADWACGGKIDVAPVIRRAVSEPYENRKWADDRPPEDLVFILDRRINWAHYPRTRERCLAELGKPDNIARNQGSFQWAIASLDYRHEVFPIHPVPGTTEAVAVSDRREILKATKSKEIGDMISDRSVFFHHRRSAFFLLPSGDVSDFFLRVGNIQSSKSNLRRLAYWSLPHLKDVDHVVSESWTISSTAAYMSQLANHYDPDIGCEWSYLEQYLTADSADVQHIQELSRSRNASNGDVLFVVSASASGRLIQLFDDVLRGDPNAGRFRRLTLFSLRDQERVEPALYSLGGLLKENDLLGPSSVEDVGNAQIIHVDPRTYIPVYRAKDTTTFKASEDTKDAKEFFHKYSGNGIFSVSRRGRTFQGRHHSFHVDIVKLLEHPHFHLSLREKLKVTGGCDAIIYVDSLPNREFAKLVQDIHQDEFGARKVNSFNVRQFDEIAELSEISDALASKDKNVLILESIFVTGTNLSDLSRTIRKMADRGQGSKSRITYLIGLNRPHSLQKQRSARLFDKASGHAGFRGCLEAVETVLLPLFSTKDCPWQRELNAHLSALDAFKGDDADRHAMLQRIYVLQNAIVTGLRGNDVFFKRSDDADFDLSSGSYFLDLGSVIKKNAEVGIPLTYADVDQADVACAVASSVHRWRCRASSNRVLFDEVPFDNLIDPGAFIDRNMFNDSLLRVAIWRALQPSEMDLRRSHSDSGSFLSRILCDGSMTNGDRVLAGEAVLAFSWQIRQVIGDERFGKIEWEYLKDLAEAVGNRFAN